MNTEENYDKIVETCRSIFVDKTSDYGTAWRILRPSSLTDQIFIKAKRIRTLQESSENKVGESIEGEFKAIINYCIMAQIQLNEENLDLELDTDLAVELYDKWINAAKTLMIDKNHDYGEAWRNMRVESLTDLILMKILRVKQIENNKGKTVASEGIDANYFDMLNYAIFSLILLS